MKRERTALKIRANHRRFLDLSRSWAAANVLLGFSKDDAEIRDFSVLLTEQVLGAMPPAPVLPRPSISLLSHVPAASRLRVSMAKESPFVFYADLRTVETVLEASRRIYRVFPTLNTKAGRKMVMEIVARFAIGLAKGREKEHLLRVFPGTNKRVAAVSKKAG